MTQALQPEALRLPAWQPIAAADFQQRVQPWMLACFGAAISADVSERNHRFLEEALELVQACGCTGSEARQLVDYVYGRPLGEKHQEVGGVMVTLAALCLAQGLDMHAAGDTELERIWTKVDAIRAKQATKPKHSPLPATQEVQRYRLLKRGEAIEAADEFLWDDFSWRIDPKGIFCGEPWGYALRAARRAIAAQAAQGGADGAR